MFKKILIANRGEIACRVIKTARAMGIKTVAVYSEADMDAKHVTMADEAVFIGPPPAAESYLIGDKIIAACKETGAEAIHPGYGFLSENAGFLKAVEKAGLVFIGPGEKAITSMGDKITSKKIAADAGVSTVPGYMGLIADEDEAAKIASQIGYPVMIKASAGGGGKGMRIAYDGAQAREGFTSARNEAKSSFADDRIFIEKFIEEPRHIEIQVLGDKHGNIIHLGERECSIQRRHQKVIEEAPSPFLDSATREKMGAEAIALGAAVGYYSAGTVEFIVDKDRNFYFLEMNTRLQVEHPVTEKITGVDLVEQMLRVANGEKLSITQKDVKLNGWAMESRVYAEDPFRGFLPSIGRLTRYVPPAEDDHVRVDTGVYEGAEITMFYDPMIAKLVTWEATRDGAIATMRDALDAYYIRGISHNIPFLSAVMAHPRFQAGRITTAFIAEEYADGFSGGTLNAEVGAAMVATAAYLRAVDGWRITGDDEDVHIVVLDGVQYEIGVVLHDDGADISLNGDHLELVSDWVPGMPVFVGEIAGRHISIEIDVLPKGYRLTSDGVSRDVAVLSPRAAALYGYMPEKVAKDTSSLLLCPMPGLMVSVNVAEGDEVKAGQALCVVEAMKMENILRAEKDGVIARINAGQGDPLAVDDVIMEFQV